MIELLQLILNALLGRRPDSYAQAIRGSFVFFQGSTGGGTMPTTAISKDVLLNDCSDMIACAGLTRKTVEIRMNAADAGGLGVIIEGTISEGANDKAFWFPLTGAINAPGLFTIETGIGAASALFYEPDLTWIRIRAHAGEVGVGTFPASIAATMAAVYEGYRWDMRFKGKQGIPEPNPSYYSV